MPPVPDTRRRSLLARVLRNPLGAICVGYLVLIVLAGVMASSISGHHPNEIFPREIRLGPSAAHWMGTDSSGRDIFSRLLHGTLPTLRDASIAVIVASLLGTLFGLAAGYFGKWLETIGTRVADLLMALPGLVVLLAVRTVVGPSMPLMMVALGIVMSGGFFRVVYAAVLGVRNELFVDAARVFRLSDTRIILRHILPTVRGPAVILAANLMAISIAIQAGLVFLGLGDLFAPGWGNLLNGGFANIYTVPLELLWPSVAIGLTCVVFFLSGNVVRDEFARIGISAAAVALEQGAAEVSAPVDDNTGAPRGRAPVAAHVALTDNQAVLAVRGLVVGYPGAGGQVNRVVDAVDLQVDRGEIHGLIGESGSGKSQVVLSIIRLLPAGGRILAGSVFLGGRDVLRLKEREMDRLRGRYVAYIPQEPMSNLDPVFTVGSQLVEPMRIQLGLGRRAARNRAMELLEQVGIEDPKRVFHSYPHQISGGMAQRILIAGAISCGPSLLIADEPTTALDVTIQAEILELLRELRRQLDLAVLLVTHNLGVVADICDRVSVMRSGGIVETGSVAEVFADPQHPCTRALFAATLDDVPARAPYARRIIEANHG
ncbi:MAG: dipeptide/oligopeptide/nickel ABC transporter permease/ATP-binding protein [Gammaproteobacteria bacterium]|nr:dipeptide/oligopeptide/nickel ABC transporter permease/ATP-binding protein [Gammaproteobacteria bacterium]